MEVILTMFLLGTKVGKVIADAAIKIVITVATAYLTELIVKKTSKTG